MNPIIISSRHPGPINRGVELADGPNSSILRQVSNGLAIRKRKA